MISNIMLLIISDILLIIIPVFPIVCIPFPIVYFQYFPYFPILPIFSNIHHMSHWCCSIRQHLRRSPASAEAMPHALPNDHHAVRQGLAHVIAPGVTSVITGSSSGHQVAWILLFQNVALLTPHKEHQSALSVIFCCSTCQLHSHANTPLYVSMYLCMYIYISYIYMCVCLRASFNVKNMYNVYIYNHVIAQQYIYNIYIYCYTSTIYIYIIQ